jgi:hypothetical protein
LIAQERIDREADPAKWMLYINDLRSRAHAREADAELARLRERFPQFAPAKPATPSSAP